MKIIYNESLNAYFNIACEEYLLENFDEDILYLYQNSPSIIVGRNKTTHNEINFDIVKEQDIPIVRRLSGGGAVYQDIGNLNFCFIYRNVSKQKNDIEICTKPIIDFLHCIGVNAKFENEGNMTIGGMNFSKNSKYIRGKDALLHGTLLYISKLGDIAKFLKVSKKSSKQQKKKITNISYHLPNFISINEFISYMIEYLREIYQDSHLYDLTNSDVKAINALIETKYKTWEWNHENTPYYSYKKSIDTKDGNLQVSLSVKNGLIESLKFIGDFHRLKDLKPCEKLFINYPHNIEAIKELLKQHPAKDYFDEITEAELMKVIF